MKVGIIIVTYNNQKDIGRLLDSIALQKYKKYKIYLVDNNSNDETLKIVQTYENKLNIEIINSKINNGFAKGNNIGIKKAMEEGCEFVFILNPDIQLDKNCLELLISRISKDNSIGAIGPMVLYGNNHNIIQTYGINVNFKTQNKISQFSNIIFSKNLPEENYVDCLLGGAMVLRCSILKIIGLFEESYFMYNDEMDLFYRIKNAGFKTLCLRDAKVFHYHNYKDNRKNNLMYYYIIRNKYLYFKKYRFYLSMIISLLKELLFIPLVIRWAAFKIGNIKLIKYYYSGLFDGLLGRNGCAKKLFE